MRYPDAQRPGAVAQYCDIGPAARAITAGSMPPLARRVSDAGLFVKDLIGSPTSTSDGNREFESVVRDRKPDSDRNRRSPYSETMDL